MRVREREKEKKSARARKYICGTLATQLYVSPASKPELRAYGGKGEEDNASTHRADG